eukprot:gene21513-16433_t
MVSRSLMRLLATTVFAANMAAAAIDGLFPDVGNVARRLPVTVTLSNGESQETSRLTDASQTSSVEFGTSEDTVVEIDLGEEFEVFQAYLKFGSARPASAVLERSIDGGGSWQALQYFSEDCKGDFDMKAGVVGKVPKAICTDNDSEQSKGLLSFEPYDPLFKNPENLDNKGGVAEALFQLLRAERVRLRIIRAFDGESKFTVVDLKVNGRQNCHGHGLVSDDDGSCVCEHGTEGDTCDVCKALFNGAPRWYRWTKGTPFQCVPCECNNHADACEYDADVQGGVCTDCQHDTNGEQCDKCDA